ncbi:MAG TPA: hypothetical protein VM577_18855 [Anaerovoracaceae bacterium]|nr:hypothetical protein [Anaerovoracaceae bacterium]
MSLEGLTPSPSAKMIYEVWESKNENSYTFMPASGERPAWLEEDAKLIHTIEADNWNEAMVKYHKYMDWEPYQPSLDELGL